MPSDIGDLIVLVVTYTPPAGSVDVVTAAQMLTRSPAGVVAMVDGVEVSPNVWRFTADDRIDEAGMWTVRVNANAGLVDSFEVPLIVNASAFAEPLP